MPSAVNTPPRRPPTIVLRTTSAVSGPGVMMTKSDMPLNARNDVSIFCSSRLGGVLQVDVPGLADEIDAEGVVRLGGRAFESRMRVNAARREQVGLRPQRHGLVARLLRETQALVHQPLADSKAARLRVDDEQAQLGDRIGLLHHEGRADAFAVHLG